MRGIMMSTTAKSLCPGKGLLASGGQEEPANALLAAQQASSLNKILI